MSRVSKPFNIYFKPDFLFLLFLLLLALFTVLGAIFTSIWLMLFAVGFAALCIFRVFSRNLAARAKENEWAKRVFLFVPLAVSRSLRRFSNRRHSFAVCPSCGARLRFPKTAGSFFVRCPRCQTKFPIHIK